MRLELRRITVNKILKRWTTRCRGRCLRNFANLYAHFRTIRIHIPQSYKG
jgi:hypothetical protein